MDQDSDLLLERKDGKRKTDLEDGPGYYEGLKKPETKLSRAWAAFKWGFPNCLNIFTFWLAAWYVLPIAYTTDLGGHWYSNFLMPYAIICYALGTFLGVVLKFTEGNLLSRFFPRRFAHRRMTYQEFEDIGQAGFWMDWLVIFSMILYVELTASIVGRITGLSEVIGQEHPGFRVFTNSFFKVEPATFLVVFLVAIMMLPMWHKTKFDLAFVGLSPLFIANGFPLGFPIYRLMVGGFSIHAKLVELHKEHLAAKASAQKHLEI